MGGLRADYTESFDDNGCYDKPIHSTRIFGDLILFSNLGRWFQAGDIAMIEYEQLYKRFVVLEWEKR